MRFRLQTLFLFGCKDTAINRNRWCKVGYVFVTIMLRKYFNKMDGCFSFKRSKNIKKRVCRDDTPSKLIDYISNKFLENNKVTNGNEASSLDKEPSRCSALPTH